ncbi:MAG: rod shape-determining protein MreD [Candidatus Eremiobacterota bacterium]
MFFFTGVIIMIISIIIQGSVLSGISWKGVIPDLTLIVVVSFSLHGGEVRGSMFGFIAGMVQDFISLKSLGACCISKTSTGLLAGYSKDNFSNSNLLTPVIIVIISTFINESIHLLFYFTLGTRRVLPPNFIEKILIQVLLNLIFLPFFLLLFANLNKLFSQRYKTRYNYE